MGKPELLAVFAFELGPLHVGPTVLTTWVLMIVLGVVSALATRRLQVDTPTRLQTLLEGLVSTIDTTIRGLAPLHSDQILPFVGTLWIFVGIGNLAGLLPGMRSPTGELPVAAALAALVFVSVHWFGIRAAGLAAYLRHYLAPNPLLLPFHLLSEITRTVALAVRLFGNMMSLEMAALLILLVAGLLTPVPLLMLHIAEALVQAYIFGMLALVYIAGGLESQHVQNKE
jgi:F-type H+-transporting ATPase subunit a